MKVLKKGDKGRDVAELQQALAGLGYQPEDAAWQTEAGDAGVFGEQTAKAVNRFRAGFGWDPYGQATVNTRRAIQAEVAALQRKLAALGLYQGAVHGRFDDATRQALAAFQTASLPGRTAAGGCLDP
ncbi:MAG: peptidoglycan-binding domain-containing protein, partial [Gallionellaceae bacterium]|nr:peptidoglycan-binding domain-containing protein [Gallionellaceae bacterium]